MKLHAIAFAVALTAAFASAQTSLAINPTGPLYIWTTPPPSGQSFFDVTVAPGNSVTIHTIDVATDSPAGTEGTIEVYTTPTTYVGQDLNAAAWTLVGTGSITATGSLTPSNVCISPAFVLAPGSYGIAVRFVGIEQIFAQGTGAFSDANLSVATGYVQYQPWTLAMQGPYSFIGGLNYDVGVTAHACATATSYGEGCYRVEGTFQQLFTTPAVASSTLTGRSLSMFNVGNGYVVTPGAVAYIPPTAAATSLTAIDDGETVVTLPQPFPYPAGSATDLYVHSNGFVSVGTNDVIPGTNNWTPVIASMCNATNAAWWTWHDFNPTEAGSGLIKWEVVGGTLMCITWDNVENYPVGVVNPSTFQYQFDLASGTVHFVWVTMDAVGGSPFGDETLVGYSPGGPSQIPAPIDIATFSVLNLLEPELAPLTLRVSGRPRIGTTFDLITSNETGPGVGVNLLSLVGIPAPGVDLGFLGAPGCPALLDVGSAVNIPISNVIPGLTMTVTFPLPNDPLIAGTQVFSQSAWLDPVVNPFGVLTSNGVALDVQPY